MVFGKTKFANWSSQLVFPAQLFHVRLIVTLHMEEARCWKVVLQHWNTLLASCAGVNLLILPLKQRDPWALRFPYLNTGEWCFTEIAYWMPNQNSFVLFSQALQCYNPSYNQPLTVQMLSHSTIIEGSERCDGGLKQGGIYSCDLACGRSQKLYRRVAFGLCLEGRGEFSSAGGQREKGALI